MSNKSSDTGSSVDYRALRSDLYAGGERAARAEDMLLSLGRASWIKLLEDASMDAKTKLYTQESLESDIHDVLANPQETGLLIVTDLVKFKSINDQFGQEFGDTIISTSASGLHSVVSKRRRDTVYLFEEEYENFLESDGFRIGGDEFAVLLRNGDSLQRADIEKIVRRKVLGILSFRPLVEKLEDAGVSGFGVRAGATLVDIERHANFKEVLRDADPKKCTMCEYHLIQDDDHLIIKKII
jgi:diguanylate cyclase (GGDEF)-like protein